MEFYLNGERKSLEQFDPNMTVLRYLRTQAGLNGTKEGCASGDCGACTVLVKSGDSKFLSVNSCIALIGRFNGAHLYTVEGLANTDASDPDLHPVQQAMVDCHASQCGFCTPGFVMSLAGLYENSRAQGLTEIPPAEIYDAISGNLCRCTGYRPILEAASEMLGSGARQASGAVAFHNPILDEPVSGISHSFDASSASDSGAQGYFRPDTEEQLQALLGLYPHARILAGGTDMVLEITQNYQCHDQIIDLSSVSTMKQVRIDETDIAIGAAVTYSELESEMSALSEPFVALLHRLGSRQIRNTGTLGGNIANASPIGDTPPVMMIWNADVEIVDAEGARRWVGIDSFYLGYKQTQMKSGEYISAMRIPLSEIHKPHRIYKISKRFEDDISAVLGAYSMDHNDSAITSVRIAYGGVAATPVRAIKTEQYLAGATLENGQLSAAQLSEACALLAKEFSPLSDVRASAAYRTEMIVNLFSKAVAEMLAGDGENLMTHPTLLAGPHLVNAVNSEGTGEGVV